MKKVLGLSLLLSVGIQAHQHEEDVFHDAFSSHEQMNAHYKRLEEEQHERDQQEHKRQQEKHKEEEFFDAQEEQDEFHDAMTKEELEQHNQKLALQERDEREAQELAARQGLSGGTWGGGFRRHTREDEVSEVLSRVPTQGVDRQYEHMDAKDFWVGITDHLVSSPIYTIADYVDQYDPAEADRQHKQKVAKRAANEKELNLRREALAIEEKHPEVKNSRHEALGFARVFDKYIKGDAQLSHELMIGDKILTPKNILVMKEKYKQDYNSWKNAFDYTYATEEGEPKAVDYFAYFLSSSRK